MNRLFDFKQIENLPFSKRVSFLRQFGKVCRGSSRLVLELDDKWVIKVAYNKKGIAQNKVEYYTYKIASSYERKFFARINLRVQWSSDYIIQERVSVLRKNKSKKIQHFSTSRFKDFCKSQGLYEDEITSQLGHNSKGKIVAYDYGFDRKVKRLYL